MRVRRRPSFSLSVVAMIDRLLEHRIVVAFAPPSAASPSPVPSMRAPSAAAEEAVEALRAARAASGARAPFAPDAPADAGAPDAATAWDEPRGLTNTERHEMDQLREKYGAHQRARDARSGDARDAEEEAIRAAQAEADAEFRARPVATAEDRAARRSVVACFACQGQRTIKGSTTTGSWSACATGATARASSSTARPCPRAAAHASSARRRRTRRRSRRAPPRAFASRRLRARRATRQRQGEEVRRGVGGDDATPRRSGGEGGPGGGEGGGAQRVMDAGEERAIAEVMRETRRSRRLREKAEEMRREAREIAASLVQLETEHEDLP